MKRSNKNKIKIANYFGDTYKNKLYAIGLFILGIVSVIPDSDFTALIFMLFFAIPLFFAKENWIDE